MSEIDVAGASKPSRRLTFISILLWLLLALALPLASLTLNAFKFAGFPLGFWITAQGAFMGLSALAIVFTVLAGGRRDAEGFGAPLAFAGEAIASAGFLGFAGLIAQIGFDALAYPLGVAAGLALMAILVAPRFPLYPAASLTEFLNARFGGRWTSLIALGVTGIASIFLIAADVRGSGLAVQALTGIDQVMSLAAGAALLALLWLGSRLSVVWRGSSLVYAVLLAALSAPLLMLTILQNRLPLPYWSYGFALQDAASMEQALIVQKLADVKSLKPLASPFLTASAWNFAGLLIALSFGIAALPQFLGRHLSQAVVSPGEASRRATLTLTLVAIFLCGLAPYAAFTRAAIDSKLQSGVHTSELPAEITAASGLKWLQVCGVSSGAASELAAACAGLPRHKGILRLQDLEFGTDSYLFAAAKVSGLALPFFVLLGIGALAAALAAGHCVLAGFANACGPGLVAGVEAEKNSAGPLVAGTGLLILGSGAAALSTAELSSLAAEGLALFAASIFPVVVLSLFWRRFNAPGALAAMFAGSAVALVYIAGVRLLPAVLFEHTGHLSNAAPGAVRKYRELRAAAEAAADPAARAAAFSELNRHAQTIANWWGLKPAAVALLAVPAAFLAGAVTALLTGRSLRAPSEGQPSGR